MSKPISWRPAEGVEAALDELVNRTGKKRGKLLDHLILTALRGPEILADNAQVVAPPVYAGGIDHAKLAAFQEKAGMTIFDAKKRGKR